MRTFEQWKDSQPGFLESERARPLWHRHREGYVYDPAKTPLQRVLLSGVLPAQKQQELTEVAQALDPIRLI